MAGDPWLPLCDRCANIRPFPVAQMVEVDLLDLHMSAGNGCSCCKLILQYHGTESDDWDEAEIGYSSTSETNYGVDALWIRIMQPKTGGSQEVADDVQSLKFDIFQTKENPSLPTHKQLSLGQINEDPESDECFSLLNYWISVCQDGHEKCHQLDSSLPSRVIDVQNENPILIKSDGLKGAYATLSHCWGRQKLPTTTCENIVQRYKNIELSELPQTYKDAIKITKRLQIQYLWIDSLCIIQDSVPDWQEESKQMKEYYRNSRITISALDSTDSRGGILKQRILRPSVPLNPQGNLFIRKSAPTHRQVFGFGPLNTRGWALQERLLSTRIVHYGSQEMFWECLSCACREGSPFVHEQPYSPGYVVVSEGVDFKRIITYLESFSKNRPASVKESGMLTLENDKILGSSPTKLEFPLGQAISWPKPKLDTASRSEEELPDSLWWRIVTRYSGRYLTKHSDRLVAISGLAYLFREATKHEYLAGIWREDLDDLLWFADPWRTMSIPDANELLQEYAYQAPSWSWAAIPWSTFYPCRGREHTFHTIFDLRIIEAGITPLGVDTFGQISDGFIKVSGFYLDVIQFHPSAEEENFGEVPLEICTPNQVRLPFGTARLDDMYNIETPPKAGINYTALFVLERGNQSMDMEDIETYTHGYALLLHPSDRLIDGQQTWKRLGACEPLRSPRRPSNDWQWREGSFTIV
ncbi:heterokaryon incompatibility protein-domain-containing protein [Tricladium varicosporioides]|nr:heterokaryon incompatibility protein-domain-containing protein [Hymenoscyphus varicosporioides]